MTINHITLPPVSSKFYDRLVQAFPPLSPLDINKGTDMIDIHRNAAQQEVIHYISKYVTKDTNVDTRTTVWERFKYLFKL